MDNTDRERYYAIANKYFDVITEEKPETVFIKNKSISYLLDHDMIPTPAIGVELEVYTDFDKLPIGRYILYLDEEDKFVDEFYILEYDE